MHLEGLVSKQTNKHTSPCVVHKYRRVVHRNIGRNNFTNWTPEPEKETPKPTDGTPTYRDTEVMASWKQWCENTQSWITLSARSPKRDRDTQGRYPNRERMCGQAARDANKEEIHPGGAEPDDNILHPDQIRELEHHTVRRSLSFTAPKSGRKSSTDSSTEDEYTSARESQEDNDAAEGGANHAGGATVPHGNGEQDLNTSTNEGLPQDDSEDQRHRLDDTILRQGSREDQENP